MSGVIRIKPTVDRLGLPYWEQALLRDELRSRRRDRGSRLGSRRLRSWQIQRLAARLDALRDLAAKTRPPLVKEQKRFRGNRKHLDLLARSLIVPTEYNEWNAWRSRFPKIIPNLRGIRLQAFDLRHLSLDRARMNNAGISDCSLRAGRLKHVVLRGAQLNNVDLTSANLLDADLCDAWIEDVRLTGANLVKARLCGAKLINSSLNRAYLQHTNLSNALIWGTSAWQTYRNSKTQQRNIRVGLDFRDPAARAAEAVFGEKPPDIDLRVNDIGVADFISLVADNRKHIASILDVASSRLVLLLGRFRGRQKRVLRSLEEALPKSGYVPMIFDFAGPKDRDVIETVAILAGLSKFVIADLTTPRSTPLESHLIIPDMAVPFVPIIRNNAKPFSMFLALQRKYPWVLTPVRYDNEADLIRQLKTRVIERASARATRLRRLKHPPEPPT